MTSSLLFDIYSQQHRLFFLRVKILFLDQRKYYYYSSAMHENPVNGAQYMQHFEGRQWNTFDFANLKKSKKKKVFFFFRQKAQCIYSSFIYIC